MGQVLHAAVAMAGAIAMFADCIDPAQSTPPAAEQRHTAPRPTPTPGTVLVLPTPEPSALADEAYSVLADLTTQYSPRESGADQELEAALTPRRTSTPLATTPRSRNLSNGGK